VPEGLGRGLWSGQAWTRTGQAASDSETGYDSENEIRSAGDLCKYRPQVQNNIFPKTGLEANEQNEIKKNQLLDT